MELGWHTVPLKGKLERLEDGKKTIPVFEKGWREHYQQTVNKTETKLGGTITGECSGILAIDCDNAATYQMFKSFDPDYKFVFVSKGKGYEAGTFIYKFNSDMPISFSIADDSMALDYYANNGFVYLPTDANHTKVPFESIPQIKEIPLPALSLLKSLHTLKNKSPEEIHTGPTNTGNCLAPLVEQFLKEKDFMPGLFKIITPKDFRKEEEYVKKGYLHPKNVPAGRGSEYLSKISAILGADQSVNTELYVAAITYINTLWDDPIDEDRLDKTIMDPMITGKAAINGQTIWQYDEDWKKYRLVLQSKRHSNIELGFDDQRNNYYCVDAVNEHVKSFSHDAEFQSYIDAVAVNAPTKKEVKRSLPLLNVVSDPSRAFGFHFDDDIKTLNTFVQTPELNILNNPEDYADYYNRPSTTIKYFETLVPDEEMRNYLLSFVKRKLLTFEYSPTVLYFMGVHGSGKDTFVSILEKIIGGIARPTVKEFLEKNNYWIIDTYFAQLDEFGNQLTRLSDKEEALGKLKAYTGKPQVQIRKMRTDGFPYVHSVTFVMTANKNPLMLEEGDRRIAFFPTPNKLENQEWVLEAGGGSAVWHKIMSEVKDFCYYLATEVDMLSAQQYISPPNTESKLSLIADSMFAASRLAFVLKNRMWDYLKDLAAEHGIDAVKEGISNKKLTEDQLELLYDSMTDMNGDIKSLNRAIRNAGIEILYTDLAGEKAYYYNVFPSTPFEEEE